MQRILDREKEYLEEQLLREKRENKAKDAIVQALKADIAHIQSNMSGINKSAASQSFETKPSTGGKKKKKRSTSNSRCQMDFNKMNQENYPPQDLASQLQAQLSDERKQRQDLEFLLSIKDKEIS